jgi:hypothetical protein
VLGITGGAMAGLATAAAILGPSTFGRVRAAALTLPAEAVAASD